MVAPRICADDANGKDGRCIFNVRAQEAGTLIYLYAERANVRICRRRVRLRNVARRTARSAYS